MSTHFLKIREIRGDRTFNFKMIWLLLFVIHEILASSGNMVLRNLGEKEYSLIKGKKKGSSK